MMTGDYKYHRGRNMGMDEIYAEKWQLSSKFFQEKGYYKQMAEVIKPYKTIFELGCGVGYSTLSLVHDGHNVIVVEKNKECLQKAKNLIHESGHESEVTFLLGDIVDKTFRNSIIEQHKVDLVICWNPGTQMDKESLQHYTPCMLEYGLTLEQIKENPASSYTEMMLWYACKTARAMGASMHIIDRCGKIDENTADYYRSLGAETGFSHFSIGTMEAETISDGGVPLISQGSLMNVSRMSVVFVSVLFT